jgi:hypothetical protein
MSANLTISQIQQNQLQASQIIQAHFEQLVTDLEQLKRAPAPKAQVNSALVALARLRERFRNEFTRERAAAATLAGYHAAIASRQRAPA